MTIRLATNDDAASVREVHVSSIRSLCAEAYTPDQIEAWAGPRKPDDYSKPIAERRLFVAEVERRVVGFAEYEEDRINAVYVHPDYARRGVGKALFWKLVEEFRANRVTRVSLHASLPSVLFYLAMGCEKEAESHHCFRSGVEIPCVRMSFEVPQSDGSKRRVSTR